MEAGSSTSELKARPADILVARSSRRGERPDDAGREALRAHLQATKASEPSATDTSLRVALGVQGNIARSAELFNRPARRQGERDVGDRTGSIGGGERLAKGPRRRTGDSLTYRLGRLRSCWKAARASQGPRVSKGHTITRACATTSIAVCRVGGCLLSQRQMIGGKRGHAKHTRTTSTKGRWPALHRKGRTTAARRQNCARRVRKGGKKSRRG